MTELPFLSISDDQMRSCRVVLDRDEAAANVSHSKVMIEHHSVGTALVAADNLARRFPGRRFWMFACTGLSRIVE